MSNVDITLTTDDISRIKRYLDNGEGYIDDILYKICNPISKLKKNCPHVYSKNSTIPSCKLCGHIKED